MAIKLSINIELKPKPRGQLGKYGNMTHSIGHYRQWQSAFVRAVKQTNFLIPSDFYAIIFHFRILPKPGRAPDLSNLQGAVEDALVKSNYLKDDNWKILSRYYTQGSLSDTNKIDLYIAESKKEFLFIIDLIAAD